VEGRSVEEDVHVRDRGRDTGGRTYKENKEAIEGIDECKRETKGAEEKTEDVMGEVTTSTGEERKHRLIRNSAQAPCVQKQHARSARIHRNT